METTTYQRKPIYAEAVRVTAENMSEVAGWCQGHVASNGSQSAAFVKVRVHNPNKPRHTKAFVGDWVLYSEFFGYKVYTDGAFKSTFIEVQ